MVFNGYPNIDVKNETLNLHTWVEHYLWQGVEHFFLIDNGSTDSPLNILQPYIDSGRVTYEYRPQKHVQPQHYAHMFRTYQIATKTEWLLVCDLDEFMFGAKPDMPLAARLRHLDPHYDAVYVHWLIFASAEFLTDPKGSAHRTSSDSLLTPLLDPVTGHPLDIRQALTLRRASHDVDHKYLVRTSIVRDASQLWIHCVLGHAPTDRVAFDDLGLRLFHYKTQSRHYFQTVKMVRGDADGCIPDNARDWSFYDKENEGMNTTDTLLRDMLPT